MNRIAFTLLAAAAVAALNARPAAAEIYRPWCLQGFETCTFTSWEQCMMTAREGLGNVCVQNPFVLVGRSFVSTCVLSSDSRRRVLRWCPFARLSPHVVRQPVVPVVDRGLRIACAFARPEVRRRDTHRASAVSVSPGKR